MKSARFIDRSHPLRKQRQQLDAGAVFSPCRLVDALDCGQFLPRQGNKGWFRLTGKVTVREHVDDFRSRPVATTGGVIRNEQHQLLRWFEHEEAAKRDQIAFMAYPAQTIAPGLVEAHADRWHLVARAELWSPHGLQRFRLQYSMAVEFSTVQQGLAEAAHIRCGRRD